MCHHYSLASGGGARADCSQYGPQLFPGHGARWGDGRRGRGGWVVFHLDGSQVRGVEGSGGGAEGRRCIGMFLVGRRDGRVVTVAGGGGGAVLALEFFFFRM